MSNSTFFKLGNGNFVLHGYDTERGLKRAERDVKRALAALAQGSVYEVVAELEPYRRAAANGEKWEDEE